MFKKYRIVKSLRTLFIGQLLLIVGVLSELSVLYAPFIYIALFFIAGIIALYIGIIKLARFNKFFLLSAISLFIAIALSVATTIVAFVTFTESIIPHFDSILNVIIKTFAMLFTFGIIRGCSKEATGSASSKFAKVESIINFSWRTVVLICTILNSYVLKEHPVAVYTLTIISTVISILGEAYFTVYIYRSYRKCKMVYKCKEGIAIIN